MKLKILGSGQDAGIPHTSCYCEICSKARKNIEFQRMGPSIAIFDKEGEFCYIIDASPDIKYQLDMLNIEEIIRNGKTPINAIFLTHAHFGHCSGLWYLGKESINETNVPVYCTQKMRQLLENNYPFSFLIQNQNIIINEITPNKELELNDIKVKPIEVPHRNEFTDTVGFEIKSRKRIFYIPDIDFWNDEIIEEIKNSDIAIIDGSFYSKDELPRFSDVPHPPILETIELLKDVDTEIYFTHLNHTNIINYNKKEKKYIEGLGFKFAHDGLILEI